MNTNETSRSSVRAFHASAVLFGLLVPIGCGPNHDPEADAGRIDAGTDGGADAGARDAGTSFHPYCEPTATCEPPQGLNWMTYGTAVPLPAAYYASSGTIGCSKIVVRRDDAGVRIETSAYGSGWTLGHPDGATCDAASGACVLENAPSGTYVLGETSCLAARSCYGAGTIRFDLDVGTDTVSGFDDGDASGGCPSSCSLCE